MNEFIISPEDCLILRAFKDASSLRDAAKVLNCDPAGLLRKVQRISEDHGFLQKMNGRWTLTSSGKSMAAWVEESIATQKKLLMGNSTLRISSTTWLLEQFLIPNIKDLKLKMSPETSFQFSTPQVGFESHLLEGSCDYVIVCHPPEDPAIAHKQLFKEEWIVVAPVSWREKNNALAFNSILKRPFIRHGKLNPDLFGLNSAELSAITSITADNLISVRASVKEGEGWSVVPKMLVSDLLKSKKILQIDYPIEMDRKLCLWWLRSRSDSKRKSGMINSWLLDSFMNM